MAAVRGSDVAWGRGGSGGGGFWSGCGGPWPRGRSTPGTRGRLRAPRWSRSVEPPGCGCGGLRASGRENCVVKWSPQDGLPIMAAGASVPSRRRRFRADAAPPSSTPTVRKPVPRRFPGKSGWGQEKKTPASWLALCCLKASLCFTESGVLRSSGNVSALLLCGCS